MEFGRPFYHSLTKYFLVTVCPIQSCSLLWKEAFFCCFSAPVWYALLSHFNLVRPPSRVILHCQNVQCSVVGLKQSRSKVSRQDILKVLLSAGFCFNLTSSSDLLSSGSLPSILTWLDLGLDLCSKGVPLAGQLCQLLSLCSLRSLLPNNTLL